MRVQFPGLWGLEFNINNWAFQIFGIKIYWYGIIIAFAFLIAVILAMKSCRKYDLEPDDILDLVLFAAPVAIICARIYYVIFSWDKFKDNLWEIFAIRNGGLAIYGGVIGAIAVALIFAKKRKIPFFKLADFGVPYLALGQAIGRWGNFVNQEAFGAATTLPWRMNGDAINNYLRSLPQNVDLTKVGVHPTFLYESLWDFMVFLFLAHYRKKKKIEGEVLFLYLILYGAGRFLIEGLRTDSLMLGSIRVSQMLSFLLLLVFSTLFIYRRVKKNRDEDEELAAPGQSRYGSLLMKMREEENAETDDKDSMGHGDDGTGSECVNAGSGNDGASGSGEISSGTCGSKGDSSGSDSGADDSGSPDSGVDSSGS